MRFSRVDLPALGRPMKETRPAFVCKLGVGCLSFCRGGRILPPPGANLGDAAACHFANLERQTVEIDDLAHVRHAPEGGQEISADGLEPFTLDLDSETIPHLVHADLPAENEHAVSFVGHRLALDV